MARRSHADDSDVRYARYVNRAVARAIRSSKRQLRTIERRRNVEQAKDSAYDKGKKAGARTR